ncbi:ATP-dependent DNA helicase PIF1-like isoform X1 [Hydractinia symbiolongicarpus]|uniref:ATP-dependent DNA helicase PIF1-like isoform X1 n=1 Tax=Hydractinia symbiolongicarpus TaxID=13093 RepID=UPI00254DF0EE|nr:ATP-dependent DNA helicase PIF1-like isoform X1 [Hydractinia symbiolongicarpus]
MWNSKSMMMKNEESLVKPQLQDAETENLSLEQKLALESVKNGKNVFITGSAGVGKSYLLNRIIKSLPRSIHVTASTGVAACNIGGTTLHSFAGIGLGDKDADVLARTILKYKHEVRQRWQNCKVLVIDEISMIDGNLFTKVDEVARAVRGCPYSFGGIQVILCGDFLQLPPVKENKFAFETKEWQDLINETIVLKQVFRQKQTGFVSLLNRLRLGRITSIDMEVLHLCSGTIFLDDGIKPTRLYPHRYKCEKENLHELSKLPGKTHVFESDDWGYNDAFLEQLQKNARYAKVLELKVGAQVMLLHNRCVKSGLVNGARGVVIGFHSVNQACDEDDCEEDDSGVIGYPIVRFTNGMERVISTDQLSVSVAGKTVAYRMQVPLALAWAVSIHKSQGMTLERIDIDIAKAFEHGQAYVALSRVTSLDGLRLRDFDPGRITAHPKVIHYYKNIDPSLDKSAQEGVEELKAFIELRRNPEKYREYLQSLIPVKCSSDTDFEHNYFQHQVESSSSVNQPTKLLRIEDNNVLESPGKSTYAAVNGVCKKIKPLKDIPVNKPVSNSSPDLVETPALLKAEEKLANCISALEEIKVANSKRALNYNSEGPGCSKNDTINVDDDSDFECEQTSGVSNVAVRRSTRKRKPPMKFNHEVTIILESDEEEGEKSTSDVELFDEKSCEQTVKSASRNNSHSKPNFLSTICSDLLEISEKKQKLDMPSSDKDDEKRVQALLKEKHDWIEEKRRKALVRRWQSLKRQSVS